MAVKNSEEIVTDKAIQQHKKFDAKPANTFFDAHVIISPDAGDATYTDEEGKEKNVPREWFTFHELQEAYYRTEECDDYDQAHNRSTQDGKNFHSTPKGWDQRPSNPHRYHVKPKKPK